MRRFVSCAVFFVASAALAGTSWAAPTHQAPTTPTTWSGACNMVVAWPAADGVDHGVAVGIQQAGGMATAMSKNNANGNDGMYVAVTNTNGGNSAAC